jgi:hypothetical protein
MGALSCRSRRRQEPSWPSPVVHRRWGCPLSSSNWPTHNQLSEPPQSPLCAELKIEEDRKTLHHDRNIEYNSVQVVIQSGHWMNSHNDPSTGRDHTGAVCETGTSPNRPKHICRICNQRVAGSGPAACTTKPPKSLGFIFRPLGRLGAGATDRKSALSHAPRDTVLWMGNNPQCRGEYHFWERHPLPQERLRVGEFGADELTRCAGGDRRARP